MAPSPEFSPVDQAARWVRGQKPSSSHRALPMGIQLRDLQFSVHLLGRFGDRRASLPGDTHRPLAVPKISVQTALFCSPLPPWPHGLWMLLQEKEHSLITVASLFLLRSVCEPHPRGSRGQSPEVLLAMPTCPLALCPEPWGRMAVRGSREAGRGPPTSSRSPHSEGSA